VSTKLILAALFLLGVMTAPVGTVLLRELPGHEPEIRLVTLLVIATFMLGATGAVSIWRAEFPLVIMHRGKVARLLGALNVLLWVAISLSLLAYYFVTY